MSRSAYSLGQGYLRADIKGPVTVSRVSETSGVAHASSGCQQYLTKTVYWQNQADDDLDAAISFLGSSVMVGDMLAYDFFIDAFNFDLSQSQFFSSRYDNCQNLHQP